MSNTDDKYKYYLAYDDGDIIIRDAINKPIDRYDKEKKEWITDWDMAGIYSGDIPVKVLSKKEAAELAGEKAIV